MSPEKDAPELLYGAQEIAEFLGMKLRQAKHRIETGVIPTFKIGRSVCATRASLTKWLDQRGAAALRKTGSESADD